MQNSRNAPKEGEFVSLKGLYELNFKTGFFPIANDNIFYRFELCKIWQCNQILLPSMNDFRPGFRHDSKLHVLDVLSMKHTKAHCRLNPFTP